MNYDILFEPIKIGPVTARNRFYQVPHCNGLGHVFPRAEAAMRGMKAAGGWAVVSTQEVDIHPSSDSSPFIEGRLWDDGDMRRLALVADAVHEHGSLAAIELTHNGHAARNAHSRLPQLAVAELAMDGYHPAQCCTVTKKDIANIRRWHRKAALRARTAGFDIVYAYAAHDLALAFHFLSPKHNTRTDEYGGSIENRVRFLREIIDDTKDAVGDTCAIAVRLAVDELLGADGLQATADGRAVVELLAELPDLWDINISDWSHDSQTSRFAAEGFQEPYTRWVKTLTTKPVVGVGRFTSPDTMVAQIRRGVLDFIGAARPSIADPFLPNKIEQGRLEDIRECIGCNICVSGDMTISPIRCTQNPTMAEEYRKGWHPEIIAPARTADRFLVIGAGPAGLEAAMALGRRGHGVVIAEARGEAGGRVVQESRLPGLAAWKRVADYRLGQIDQLPEVELYLQSRLGRDQVLTLATELNISQILCATGAVWRGDGLGREHRKPITGDGSLRILTPDDIMRGVKPGARVVVYDDDHYYLGGVIAEAMVRAGAEVTIVTPAAEISIWTHNTLEQNHIEKHIRNLGINIIEKHRLTTVGNGLVTLVHTVADTTQQLEASDLVMVTARQTNDDLYFQLAHDPELAAAGIIGVARIGDCVAPSTIAAAVYSGHAYAEEFGEGIDPDTPSFRREYVEI